MQRCMGALRMPVGTDKVTGSRKLLPTLWLLSEKWGWLRVRKPVGRGEQRPRSWVNRVVEAVPPLLGSRWEGACHCGAVAEDWTGL